jgi:hypothetical protein
MLLSILSGCCGKPIMAQHGLHGAVKISCSKCGNHPPMNPKGKEKIVKTAREFLDIQKN